MKIVDVLKKIRFSWCVIFLADKFLKFIPCFHVGI